MTDGATGFHQALAGLLSGEKLPMARLLPDRVTLDDGVAPAAGRADVVDRLAWLAAGRRLAQAAPGPLHLSGRGDCHLWLVREGALIVRILAVHGDGDGAASLPAWPAPPLAALAPAGLHRLAAAHPGWWAGVRAVMADARLVDAEASGSAQLSWLVGTRDGRPVRLPVSLVEGALLFHERALASANIRPFAK